MTVSDLQFQYSDTSENQLNSQCLATLYWDKISVYVKENKLQRNPLSSLHACIKRNQVQQTLPIENVSQIRVITNGISPLFSNGHKKIINEVSGVVYPGTLLAILGSSGAGKSTLMNVLANRNLNDYIITGQVKVNGLSLKRDIRNISAYVQQADLFFSNLTVRETLVFRAMMQMEKSISKTDRLKRVEEVLLEMGLASCADTQIGVSGSKLGISGGEAKRLSFACEIITNPLLVFCDEPTSGLDTFMAQNIVQTLKAMSQKGRTILCTIHQPSSELFAMFDRLLLLAQGKVAYMGPAKQAATFFESLNYVCPTNFNPADFYVLNLASSPCREKECRLKILKICDRFTGTGEAAFIRDSVAGIVGNNSDKMLLEELSMRKQRHEETWFKQFSVVLWRSWLSLMRDMFLMRVRFMQSLSIALIIGLIYFQVDYDQRGVQNINGVLFLLITNATLTNVLSVINTFPHELPIFSREYNSRIYRSDVYFLAKTLAEFPTYIILPLIAITVDYWMIGLFVSLEKYLICAGVIVLVSNVAVSFGLFISTFTGDTNISLAVAPPILIPLMMFGGFFLNDDSVPVYFVWLQYISWFKYSNELLCVNQWKDVDNIGCDVNSTGFNCLYRNGQNVLSYLSFSSDNNWFNWVMLLTLFIGYRMLSFLCLVVRAKLSKR